MGATFELTHNASSALQRAGHANDRRTRSAPGDRSGSRARFKAPNDLIDELCGLHAGTTSEGIADAHLSDVLPPDYWMNDQLARLGQKFRVQTVDGYRYEIYDIALPTSA